MHPFSQASNEMQQSCFCPCLPTQDTDTCFVLPSVLRSITNFAQDTKHSCSGIYAVASLGIAWHISVRCSTSLSHSLAHSRLLRAHSYTAHKCQAKKQHFSYAKALQHMARAPFKLTSYYAVVPLDAAVGYQKGHAVTCQEIQVYM